MEDEKQREAQSPNVKKRWGHYTSMVNGMERKPWLAKQSAVIIFALSVLGLLSITHVEAEGDGASAPALSRPTRSG